MWPRATASLNPSVGTEKGALLSQDDWRCPCGLSLLEPQKHLSLYPVSCSQSHCRAALLSHREISVLYKSLQQTL